MFTTCIDAEFLKLQSPEFGVGQHALHRFADYTIGMPFVHAAVRRSSQTAGITGMAVIDLLLSLVAGDLDLFGIDHDDVIADIGMRGELGLALAAQNLGNFRGQTPEDFVRSVDHEPLPLNVAGLGCIRDIVHLYFHQSEREHLSNRAPVSVL